MRERVEIKQFFLWLLVFMGVIASFVLGTIVMTNDATPKGVVVILAMVIGIGGVWLFFSSLGGMVEAFPHREKIEPLVFVGPAVLLLIVFLVYPAVYTVVLSFFDYSRSTREGLGGFVGWQNYLAVFRNPKFLIALRNNLLWLLLVPTMAVSVGLIIAVLVDRIRWEKTAKSLIFLPMAISFVGAAVIWRFIYFFSVFGDQIGLLNAIVVAFGAEPQGWMRLEPANNFFLILIMIWLQTGFAMIVLSAAVKAVPASLLEAARIDGATEVQVFFRIIIPAVSTTIITVSITLITIVLKVFDIIFVMTSGQYNTEVLANMMYQEVFKAGNYGVGSAVAVILFLAVIPIMIRNIKNLAKGGR